MSFGIDIDKIYRDLFEIPSGVTHRGEDVSGLSVHEVEGFCATTQKFYFKANAFNQHLVNNKICRDSNGKANCGDAYKEHVEAAERKFFPLVAQAFATKRGRVSFQTKDFTSQYFFRNIFRTYLKSNVFLSQCKRFLMN